MKKQIFYVYFFLFLLIPAFPQQFSAQVEQLDGRISVEKLSQVAGIFKYAGSKIFFGKKGELLWIGVESDSMGVASLCIADQNEIWVLHASAALGAVTYTRTDKGWITNQQFRWELRESDMSKESVVKRMKYLEKNRWVANVQAMGSPDFVEFLMVDDLSPDATLALGIMPVKTPYEIIGLPLPETKGCASGELVRGSIPAEPMQFDPGSWIDISLQQKTDR